jgi:hypothetical protein
MFPRGRLFEAIDNKVVEEGTRLGCMGLIQEGPLPLVRFQVLSGDATGESFDVEMGKAQCHLADLGLDFSIP